MSGKIAMPGIALALIVASMMLATLVVRESSAADAPVVTKVKPVGKFTAPNSMDDGKPRGISGMACLGQPADASRECFVINDEERLGEIATLTKDGLTATGKTIDFVNKGEAGKDVLGKAQDPMCKDKETGEVAKPSKFNELDGEGIAIVGDMVYVAGSHACTKGGKYKPSSFLLIRFKADSATGFKGASPPVVERSWRLADVLLGSKVQSDYGKPRGKGTNIEGIAVIGNRLYAGLRTPVPDGSKEAFIVSARVDKLFAPGDKGLQDGEVESITLDLGKNAGVRDLAALRSGGLLILSGPAREEIDVEYKLWLLEKPEQGAVPKPLATVTTSTRDKDGELGKAETVAVLEETADRLKLLVLYDNLDEGEPTHYDIRLKAR
jgi:Protein of unknown function (DUF3616)